MPSINIPLPSNLIEATWTIIGFTLGRAGASTDHIIKESNWYKNLSPAKQKLLGAMLDFIHHFWIGLLLMVYFPNTEIYWFGYGLFIDDLPDVPSRFLDWFNHVIERLNRKKKDNKVWNGYKECHLIRDNEVIKCWVENNGK